MVGARAGRESVRHWAGHHAEEDSSGVICKGVVLGRSRFKKLQIQGRGWEKEEEENALLLGCQEEQTQSVSCHEARSRLGLWHSPMQFVWGTRGRWGYQSIPVYGSVPPRTQALPVELVTVSAAMHPGHPHGGNPTHTASSDSAVTGDQVHPLGQGGPQGPVPAGVQRLYVLISCNMSQGCGGLPDSPCPEQAKV